MADVDGRGLESRAPGPFSIVVIVKGELELLRLSMPSYYLTDPDEIVFCLESPVDHVEFNAIEKLSAPFRQSVKTKIVRVPKNPAYASQVAWKRRVGFLAASNDRILSADPDLVLNRNVHRALARVGVNDVGYASCTTVYPVRNPLEYGQAAVHLLLSRFHPPPLTGLYALWRPYWLDSEDDGIKSHPESLETEAHGSMVVIGEDTYLLNCMKRKHKAVNLRRVGGYAMKPYHNTGSHAQYELGRYHQARGAPLWSVFITAAALLQPRLMVGFVHQKNNPSEVPAFNPSRYPF